MKAKMENSANNTGNNSSAVKLLLDISGSLTKQNLRFTASDRSTETGSLTQTEGIHTRSHFWQKHRRLDVFKRASAEFKEVENLVVFLSGSPTVSLFLFFFNTIFPAAALDFFSSISFTLYPLQLLPAHPHLSFLFISPSSVFCSSSFFLSVAISTETCLRDPLQYCLEHLIWFIYYFKH